MPVTVNTSTRPYIKNSGSSTDKLSTVSSGTGFSRLSPEIQDLYFQYPFIPYIGSFLSIAEQNLENLTVDALLKLSEVAGCIKKCLSGVEYEFHSGMSITQELYITQLRTLVFILEETALQKSSELNYAPNINNARRLYVPHEVEEYIDTVKKWPLFSNFLLYDEYAPLSNLFDILIIISSNTKIVSV